MLKPDKTFDELLAQKSSWVYKGDSIFVTLARDTTRPDSFYFQYEIHASEFSKFHPALPQALVQYVERSLLKNDRFSFSGNDLGLTLSILEGKHVEYVDSEAKTIRVCDYHLAESSGDATHNMSLSGIFVGTTSEEIDGHVIRFVDSVAYDVVEVSKETLEAAYPGWFERWTIAVELGLDTATFRSFVLSKKPSAHLQVEPPLDVIF